LLSARLKDGATTLPSDHCSMLSPRCGVSLWKTTQVARGGEQLSELSQQVTTAIDIGEMVLWHGIRILLSAIGANWRK
jgi:hypothetical protein